MKPSTPSANFPRPWLKLVDEIIPTYVKDRYSPKESWKGKPFSKTDGSFFSRGILELSALFTDERPAKLPDYFAHPKSRSSYLLYFLPLQAAKFLTVIGLHEKAALAALEHGRKAGVLRIADLGAGPATASIAFLLWLSDHKDLPTKIEIDAYDTNGTILQDGGAIIAKIVESVPSFQGRVEFHAVREPWWNAARSPKDYSLVIAGNVLNETSLTNPKAYASLKTILDRAAHSKGGGMLFLEPASRKPSQLLSQIRDRFLVTDEEHPKLTYGIWGPCPHLGLCPLAHGRDWCHFSTHVDVPGVWFQFFSKALGSERHWIKYSYVWFGAGAPSRLDMKKSRLVISDPITMKSGDKTILLCEPKEAGRRIFKGFVKNLPLRGDIVPVSSSY